MRTLNLEMSNSLHDNNLIIDFYYLEVWKGYKIGYRKQLLNLFLL